MSGMLKRFVRRFGTARHGKNVEWTNSRIACAVVVAFALFFSLMMVRQYFILTDENLQEESFVLLKAEHYHRERRRSDTDELYLYSADSVQYTVEDAVISASEIEQFLTVLEPGMQIDVLLCGDSVRELVADGQLLLSKELTGERARRSAKAGVVLAAFVAVCGVATSVRLVALQIKKRKGWNF